jgi:hypothetical protein
VLRQRADCSVAAAGAVGSPPHEAAQSHLCALVAGALWNDEEASQQANRLVLMLNVCMQVTRLVRVVTVLFAEHLRGSCFLVWWYRALVRGG